MIQGATTLLAAEKTTGAVIGIVGMLFFVACLVFIVARWFLLLRQLSLVRLVNGSSENLQESLKFVIGRQGALVVIGLAIVISLILASIACGLFVILCAFLFKRGSPLSFVPIIMVYGSFFAWCISVGFIQAAGFLVACAAVCEKERISQVIAKGVSLSGRAFFRTLLGGFLIMVAVSALGPPLWLPVFVVCIADAFRMGFENHSSAIPFHWLVLWSTWESLIDMIVWPVCFIFFGLYYSDMKIRQEGQDLTDNLTKLQNSYRSMLSDGEIGNTA